MTKLYETVLKHAELNHKIIKKKLNRKEKMLIKWLLFYKLVEEDKGKF